MGVIGWVDESVGGVVSYVDEDDVRDNRMMV